MDKTIKILKEFKIKPTMHRLAVAKVLLPNREHLSADEILARVKLEYPTISRASIYNILDLFVEKKLIIKRIIKDGLFIYDPVTKPHHHLLDEKTGQIYDLPWETLNLPYDIKIPGFKVNEFYLVIKGNKI